MSIRITINDLIEKYNNYKNQKLIYRLAHNLELFKNFDVNKDIPLVSKITEVATNTYNTIEEKVFLTRRGYEELTVKKKRVGDETEVWEVTRKIIPREKYVEMIKKYDKDNTFQVNKNYVLELFK